MEKSIPICPVNNVNVLAINLLIQPFVNKKNENAFLKIGSIEKL